MQVQALTSQFSGSLRQYNPDLKADGVQKYRIYSKANIVYSLITFMKGFIPTPLAQRETSSQ